jgi:radical SAM superfamily enzyme YgiQ (UPF0313 family)
MKVALVRCPSSQGELRESSLSQHPINLLYIAAYLTNHGHKVRLFDYEVETFDVEKIVGFSPDFVGITAMTPLVRTASEIAEKIKERIKSTVVIGGNHVTALPRETLEEFPAFDIGVIGEGEETIGEICEKKELNKIRGIVYRDGEKIIVNERRPPIENLDSLPFPMRDLLDRGKYTGASTPGFSREFLKITEVYVNRGCDWGLCTFCASMVTHCKFRMRSIDNVVAELKECIQRYGINYFTIDDDTLTTSKERTLEFCNKIKPLKVTWDCDSRVTIDKEMIQAMQDSGCKKIAFGVESGSQRILQMIKKGVTVQQIRDVFKWCKEVGMRTSAFFMIGAHPEETYEDIEKTKQLIAEIQPDFIIPAIAVPYPGTELRKQMLERNLIFSNDWSKYAFYGTLPVWRTVNFSPEELLRTQQDLVRNFYMKPSYIIKRLVGIRSLGELKYWLKAFTGLKKAIFKRFEKR